MNKEQDVERIIKALANRRRLMILVCLRAKSFSTVGDLAETLRLSLKATSKHLLILKAAGIVDRGQAGLLAEYALAKPLHAIVRTTLSCL